MVSFIRTSTVSLIPTVQECFIHNILKTGFLCRWKKCKFCFLNDRHRQSSGKWRLRKMCCLAEEKRKVVRLRALLLFYWMNWWMTVRHRHKRSTLYSLSPRVFLLRNGAAPDARRHWRPAPFHLFKLLNEFLNVFSSLFFAFQQ